MLFEAPFFNVLSWCVEW